MALNMLNSRGGIFLLVPGVCSRMRRKRAVDAASIARKRLLPAVILVCLAGSGCGNSCYSGYWNANGNGAARISSPCSFTTATGTVAVQVSAASGPSAVASLPQSPGAVQHIFVTLRGIEAHASSTADEDAAGWQELVPELAQHPVQLDLLALLSLELSGDVPAPGSRAIVGVPATIPADEYRQMRLRLMPLRSAADDRAPESNACGNVGWNCMVFADRSVRPLQFTASSGAPTELDAPAEFHITPEVGADRVFRLLPDEVLHLSIEFDPASSIFFPSGTAVRLVPVFKAVSRTSPPAPNAE